MRPAFFIPFDLLMQAVVLLRLTEVTSSANPFTFQPRPGSPT